jgi:hypothetical protein
MSILNLRWLWPAAFLIAGPGAAAAPPPAGQATAAPSDPLDATAAVPPVVHRSVFSGYRAQADAPLRDWKAANEEVGRIGGWRAYAREAQSPAAPASAPAASVPPVPGRSGTEVAPAAPGGQAGHPSHHPSH